jgi:hypothetical protein
LSAISGDANNIIALITDESSARIAGDTAIVGTIAKIGAAAGDNVAFILNMDTVKLSSSETIGQRFDGIATQFAGVTASVQNEATARANADVSMAQTVAKLGALNSGGTAFIIDLNTAYVSPTESLAQKFSGITSAVNSNTAAITTEQSTRANADSSLAASITTLQSTVGGHTTTIQTQASTINGIQGKYSVKIDASGHVAGFGLIVDGNTAAPYSVFSFLADAFKIYNGNTVVAPFSVSGGIVSMQNVKIGTAVIDDLAVGTSNIANGAVTGTTIGDGNNTGATVNVASGGVYYNVPSLAVTPTGIPTSNARVMVDCMFNAEAQGASAETITIRLRRSDGTTYGGPDIRLRTSGPEVYSWVFVDDAPSASSYTYQLQITSGSSGNRGKWYESRLIATVLKK